VLRIPEPVRDVRYEFVGKDPERRDRLALGLRRFLGFDASAVRAAAE